VVSVLTSGSSQHKEKATTTHERRTRRKNRKTISFFSSPVLLKGKRETYRGNG
jgi:hypothetical protein